MTNYYRNGYEWHDKSCNYPYHAETSTELRPSKSKGADFVSAVLRRRVRTWGFRTVGERDVFVEKFNAERIISHYERCIMDGIGV